jgi:hypothetical protein
MIAVSGATTLGPQEKAERITENLVVNNELLTIVGGCGVREAIYTICENVN